ncbi:antibiotic biosynthesis monooxygenase [Streptomyces sp. ISL-11]|uniref:antibiotic biosynthesis monooxygenase n=1 Tax=Streptomyces sp. ISL-11 TaxID=2819174 RepID=UPI001BE586CF|nr:antibiotic biosynthesis monooxygenase [Streptomyces sp. ISL-11]MBT2387056.1 antibiotic biosynthesis monooxygenase [Streptomyces sp. ISL-11]
MYVRSIYATGDPAKLDGVAEALRTEGRELLSAQPGFRGMGLFADRELGKLLVGSWWEDDASRQASFENLSKRRAELMAPFAQTMTVDNWEAAVARRAEDLGPSAGFRLVRMDVEQSDTDLLVDTFRDISLPKLQKIPGLAGISLLVDRDRDRAAVGALYTDRDALVASRGVVAAVRGEAAAKVRVTTSSLEEFEVVLATAVPHV